jgi:CDP-glucose 4,6-dehydratase
VEDLVMDRAFWKGKKVLITGHTGFKGSWLSIWLRTMGASVTGYALQPPTTPSLFDLARVDRGITNIKGDVRDFESLRVLTGKESPEIIIHMAAQALVRRSYKEPLDTLMTNIMGTANVLESVRSTESVRVVLVVTSDKCYRNNEWVWGYRENEPMGGHDPYSSSKACAELVTAAYRESYFPEDRYAQHGVAIASVRAGNVIGGGDWAEDRLVPDTIRAFMAGKPIRIRSPQAVRPWQHVLEPLRGYLVLAQRLWEHGIKYSGAWNFGPREDDARPVSFLVDRLASLWGPGAAWEFDEGEQPGEAHCLKLDCSKARNELGYRPMLDLETALDWTVSWYKSFVYQKDMREVTELEIGRFENLV